MTKTATNRNIVSAGELWWVLACAVIASLAAIVWSWRNDALLNYGDAVAHMHIARRVFDCRLPRLSQLGSVWLPLPHVLMLPFVHIDFWWVTGLAGVLPSALAYIAGCVGLYRLARQWMRPSASAIALAFFALNPNLLYLQSTAMTEPLFIAEMIWIALWLVEWRKQLDQDADRARRLQIWVALGLVAAVYTRYDGWIMTALAWTAIGIELLRRRRLAQWTYWLLTALLLAAPIVWFVYNQLAFGDWLEFARGPYSAKAIELRTMSHGGGPPHPGWHNLWVSLIFYVKTAEMDAVAAVLGNCLLALTALASLAAWLLHRRRGIGWALQLLWLPIPYYAYSVAYSSVPIFIPPWWPHSWYNTRYGMSSLPAFALGIGFLALFVTELVREFKPRWAKYAVAALALLVAASSFELLREHPLTYVEGTKNRAAHRPYQQAIPPVLRAYLKSRPGATILMETSVDPEIVALTGIPLQQTLNEADLYLWDEALAAPAEHAYLVLAFDGDAVDRAVKAHPDNLQAVAQFETHAQPTGTLYRSLAGQNGAATPARW